MRTILKAAVVLLSISPSLSAQETKQRETPEQLQQRIDQRIKAMRKAISDGLPITTSVRVTVRLRNKSRIKGVVKNGRFVEKVHGLDFVKSDMQTPGAGIRVWYYNNTNSYIFLPFEAITSYKIGARLTQIQIKEIEARIERTQAEALAARKEELARRKSARDKKDAEDEAESEQAEKVAESKAEAAKKKKDDALLALLKEFPPEAGWSEDRMREIEQRKMTVGVFPDKKQQRFLEVFPQWQKAMRLKAEMEEQAGPSQAGPGPGPGGGEGATPPGGKY